MSYRLKTSKTVDERLSDDYRTRETVENILKDIERRGDKAVRELSEKFDNWNPESFILNPLDIETCMAKVSHQNLSLIHI